MIHRVALVTHVSGGGVATFTRFLYRVLHRSRRYEPEIILVATSASDSASVRLLAPQTWLRGPQIQKGYWQEICYWHVGAVLTELEFQRYQPRAVLTELLNTYDLVQVVGGTPAWGWVASQVRRPLCLFTATTICQERASAFLKLRGVERLIKRMMTTINARIEGRALRRADRVFAESTYTLENLEGIVRPERMLLGPPGVDVDFFVPSSEPAQNYVLAVGRFSDPRKNVRVLFDAYSCLVANQPNAPILVIAGACPELQDMDYLAQLGLTTRVRIYQDPTDSKLAELYRHAQFLVVSSDEEGLGIVILEAMASGLPVISTDCGGPAMAIVDGETGFLTPIRDPSALSDAMRHLLENPGLRQRMGQAGRQVAEQRFSFETAGRIYVDTYDELLSNRIR